MGDFLTNFENKPDPGKTPEKKKPISNEDAFSKEEFVYDNDYARNKLVKKIITIVIAILLFAGSFTIYTAASTTKMKNFVGVEYKNMASFVSQNNLSIVKNEEYSETITKNIIISQDVAENETIKKGSTIIVTVSAGPDPEKVIEVPDFKAMTHSMIMAWKDENKLSNVTIRTQYDAKVEEGGFLNATFVEGSQEHFKRKNRLTIYTSKGPEPVPTDVALIDFTNQAKTQIIEWGKKNEVTFEFKYYFSDTVEKDNAIRQSIASGKRVEKGSSITIDLSSGPSVTIPDFSKMDVEQARAWATDKGFNLILNEVYLYPHGKGKFISQSLTTGKVVSKSSSIEVKYALGKPYIKSFIGGSIYDYHEYADSLNKKGTSLVTTVEYEYSSSVAKHSIVYQSKLNEIVEWYTEITVVVSKGERYVVESVVGQTENDARESNLCKKMTCLFEYESNADGVSSGDVISQSFTAGDIVGLPEMITIKVKK